MVTISQKFVQEFLEILYHSRPDCANRCSSVLCIKILFALQSPVFKAYRIFAKEKGTFFQFLF